MPFNISSKKIAHVEFSPDSQHIVITESTGAAIDNIKTLKIDDHQSTLFENIPEQEFTYASFSPTGQYTALRNKDGGMEIWKTNGLRTNLFYKFDDDDISQIQFSSDGHFIATISQKGVFFWKINRTGISLIKKIYQNSVCQAEISTNSQFIAVTSNQELKIFDIYGEEIDFSQNLQSIWSRLESYEKGFFLSLFDKAWNVDGELIKTSVILNSSKINRIKISENNQYIVSVENQGNVKLWSISNKEINLVKNLLDKGEIDDLRFSPNNQLLALSEKEQGIKIWEVHGSEVNIPDNYHKGQENEIYQDTNRLEFSPNSQYLASFKSQNMGSSKKNEMKLWKVDGTQVEVFINSYGIRLEDFEFSPDSQYIVSRESSFDSKADWYTKIWRVEAPPTEVQYSYSYNNESSSVRISPNGKFMISTDADKKVNLWQIAGARIFLLRSFSDHNTQENFIFSPDSQYIAAIKKNGIKIWKIDGTEIDFPENLHTDGVSQIEFSPNSQYLISKGLNLDMKIWRIDGTQVELPEELSEGGVSWIKLSPNSQYLASLGNGQKGLKIWHMHHSKIRLIKNLSRDEIYHFLFSPNSRYISFAGKNNSINLWKTDGTEVDLLEDQYAGQVNKIKFSPDSNYLASGGMDSSNEVRLWQVDGNQINLPNSDQLGLNYFPGLKFGYEYTSVFALDFSSNSQYLVSVGRDGQVKLWQTNGILVFLTDSKYLGLVRQVKFSPDSRNLASIGGYGSPSGRETLKLWQLSSHASAVLLKTQDQDGGILFDSESRYLISIGDNDSISVRYLKLDELIAKSCKFLEFYRNAQAEYLLDRCETL